MRPNNWSDPRIAREDSEFAGIPVPKGTWLFASIIAGNYDPAVFEKPHEFRIKRERPRPILNFGSGRHLCLGRPVALVELEETLRLLVERFARIEVIGDVVRDGQPHGDFIRTAANSRDSLTRTKFFRMSHIVRNRTRRSCGTGFFELFQFVISPLAEWLPSTI